MDIALLWLELAGIAAIILVASTFLAKSADIIAVKTGLGRTFIGVVLLATATSLPELGTGISAVTFVDEPDLAAGDAFGSNLFNLLIIALLDIYWRRGPILNSVGTSSVLIAALGIALISVAAVAVVIHHSTTALDHWYISPVTVVLLACLLGAMFMIYRASQRQDETAAQDEEPDYGDASLTRAFVTYGLSAAVVVASATLLAVLGDKVAEEMGWEASYVGTQFLALSTSLPELAASFAAIRINAPELALSNGSRKQHLQHGFRTVPGRRSLYARLPVGPRAGDTHVDRLFGASHDLGGHRGSDHSGADETRQVLDARGCPSDSHLRCGQRPRLHPGLTRAGSA